MIDAHPSFEEMDVEAQQGKRPDGNLEPQQFTMTESQRVSASKLAETSSSSEKPVPAELNNVVAPYLEALQAGKIGSATIYNLGQALEGEDLSSYPALKDKLQTALKSYVETWWQEEQDRLSAAVQRQSRMTPFVVRAAANDLVVFHRLGVDVVKPAQELQRFITDNEAFLDQSNIISFTHEPKRIKELVSSLAAA